MRTLGLPEVLTIVVTFLLYLAVPTIICMIVVRWVVARQIKSLMIASKRCPHCSQQIPDIGSFCPLCGNKVS